jgi:dTMP kinase
MNKRKGKFFVIEGIDGSGKSTQTKLFCDYLKKKGEKVVKMSFPQYGKNSSKLVENYLRGDYGSSKKVGPYRASIFFACDRYDASFQIREWIEEGKIVLVDRYVSSNAGHQGGKINNPEKRTHFLKWLYDLEYNIFKIPQPDKVFILKTSPEVARKMSGRVTDEEKKKKKASFLGKKKQDIHEVNLKHLDNALKSYLELAERFPDSFEVIECLKDGELLPIETIHQKIIKKYQKLKI